MENMGRPSQTPTKFLKLAKDAYPNEEYVYPDLTHIKKMDMIPIICPKHGEFKTRVTYHLHRGSGCPKCKPKKVGGAKRESVEVFKQKMAILHNSKYTYPDLTNTKKGTVIRISCPEHGEFKMCIEYHRRGSGCPICSGRIRWMDADDFISKVNKIHDGKYSYLNIPKEFKSDSIIRITCPNHGDFDQRVNTHFDGSGCPMCSRSFQKLPRAFHGVIPNQKHRSIKEFKYIVAERHNGKYSYPGLEDVKDRTTIRITCPKHGDFYQLVSNHIAGRGCPKCAVEHIASQKPTNLRTPESFLKKARKIHGDVYEYSDLSNVRSDFELLIVCPHHGEFRQKVSAHLAGSGCPKCSAIKNGQRTIITKEEVLNRFKEAHKYNRLPYKYPDLSDTRMDTKISVICPYHGKFVMSIGNHQSGSGCPKCALGIGVASPVTNDNVDGRRTRNIRKYTPELFEIRARKQYNDIYDYDLSNFKTLQSVIRIRCHIHGWFEKVAEYHVNKKHGSGCPKCRLRISKGEQAIAWHLESRHILFYMEYRFPSCVGASGKELPFDFYLPKHNIAIEFDGEYHRRVIKWGSDLESARKRFRNQKIRDSIKTKFCDDSGIRLIRITKVKDIESILESKLFHNLNDSLVIGGINVVQNNEIKIPKEMWSGLNSKYEKTELRRLLSGIIECLPFPYRFITKLDMMKSFEALKSSENDIFEKDEFNTRYDSDKFAYQKLYVRGLNIGNKASDYFHQKNRFNCDSINGVSPTKLWNKKSHRDSFLKGLWSFKFDHVDSSVLRNVISLRNYTASQFKPSVAKAIYTHFNAKNVLDFSSGWGDRLCGFCACDGTESYVGVDPNESLVEGYEKQIEAYGEGKSITMMCDCAESVDYGDKTFDLVFTSPPYFDVERYTNNSTQSWKRYSNFELWLKNFLLKSVENAWNHLEIGGHMVINISDVYSHRVVNRICDPMNEFISTLDNSYYEGAIGMKLGKRPNTKASDVTGVFAEPMWVWRKGKSNIPGNIQNSNKFFKNSNHAK